MTLNVDHLLRTAATLEQALLAIGRTAPDDAVMFDLFRNAAIKSFELSLETCCRQSFQVGIEAGYGVLQEPGFTRR